MELDSWGVPLPSLAQHVSGGDVWSASALARERAVLRATRSLRHRARSLLRDALFVDAAWVRLSGSGNDAAASHTGNSGDVCSDPLPLFLNARCGSWYHPSPTGICCFKSADGHTATGARWAATRLNLGLAVAAARAGGAAVVDASQSAKRAPDALTRTLPLWCAVINGAAGWPGPPHLPPSVPPSEADAITAAAAAAGASMPAETRSVISEALRCLLRAPLRCVWLDQSASLSPPSVPSQQAAVVEVVAAAFDVAACSDAGLFQRLAAAPPHDWPPAGGPGALSRLVLGNTPAAMSLATPTAATVAFTPIYCISASKPSRAQADVPAAHAGWEYLPGAGDDAEHWAPRGMTPDVFWSALPALLAAETDADCERAAVAAVAAAAAVAAPADRLGVGAACAAPVVSNVRWGAHGLVRVVVSAAGDGDSETRRDDGASAAEGCGGGAHESSARACACTCRPPLDVRLRVASTREDMRASAHLWRSTACDNGATSTSSSDAGALVYTVPADKASHGACRSLFATGILPHLLACARRQVVPASAAAAAAVSVEGSGNDGEAAATAPAATAVPCAACRGAPLATVTTSPAAAPYAALAVAALLLQLSEAASALRAALPPQPDKARMRACLASVLLALGLATLSRDLEKELWRFLVDDSEGQVKKGALPAV